MSVPDRVLARHDRPFDPVALFDVKRVVPEQKRVLPVRQPVEENLSQKKKKKVLVYFTEAPDW